MNSIPLNQRFAKPLAGGFRAAAVSLILAVPAAAQPSDNVRKLFDLVAKDNAAKIAATPKEHYEKLCILAAAEKLPSIPGIEIKTSKASQRPPEHRTRPDMFQAVVEIGATAAGQSVTYTFACAAEADGPAHVMLTDQR